MSETTVMSRRTFAKGTAALGAFAAVAGAGASLFGCAPSTGSSKTAATPAPVEPDTTVWSHCNVNCGGRCSLQFQTKDGAIVFAETDNLGSSEFGALQARACLRGRTMRRWINSPDRLMYPMKRVGKRGEGKFEKISWDEAIDTISEKLKGVLDKYGNEAVYINYASGVYAITGRTVQRLMNCLGGYLEMYGTYSTAQISAATPYTYGSKNNSGSPMIEAMNSDYVLLFGNSPADTRMGGANTVHDFARVREAVAARGGKIVSIDYRLNETMSGHADEWVPIISGTDAALVSGIAYVLINENLVNKDFLDKYCVGYDQDTMPEGAPANSSYKDYIMGTGYDNVPKTPEWASSITKVPVAKITEIAHDLAAASAPFVVQGWGSQRHSNGELTARAIFMLPILTGKIGLPGTNNGNREGMKGVNIANIPNGKNPVTKTISCYTWTDAIDHGEQMTATKDGVRGADKLNVGIKFFWNYGGNCMTNQHGDINRTHKILQDESKCEFIVVTDLVMTDFAKYADILLPDVMRQEQVSMSTNGYSEHFRGVHFGQPAQEPRGECRTGYDVSAAIAEKLGVGDQFTEGKTQEEWIKQLYEEARAKDAALPTYEGGVKQGFWKEESPSFISMKAFIADPVANALDTPSGKIEIYSSKLADIASKWELQEGDVISPLPIYANGFEGPESTTSEYPLVGAGFHYKSRTHSSFGFIDVLEQSCRQQFWINPADATSRNIKTGDICAVKSPRGEIRIEAKVTPRIVPGVIGIPQGAWHDADMNGDKVDKGGCINTLTTHHPSPLVKGNPHHSNIVQVAKA